MNKTYICYLCGEKNYNKCKKTVTAVSLRIQGKRIRENFYRKFRKPGTTEKCDSDLRNNKVEGISWTLYSNCWAMKG